MLDKFVRVPRHHCQHSHLNESSHNDHRPNNKKKDLIFSDVVSKNQPKEIYKSISVPM